MRIRTRAACIPNIYTECTTGVIPQGGQGYGKKKKKKDSSVLSRTQRSTSLKKLDCNARESSCFLPRMDRWIPHHPHSQPIALAPDSFRLSTGWPGSSQGPVESSLLSKSLQAHSILHHEAVVYLCEQKCYLALRLPLADPRGSGMCVCPLGCLLSYSNKKNAAST